MNRKISIICVLLVNIVFIRSEDNLLAQTSEENLNQTVPSTQESKTNGTKRDPKDLTQIITAALAGAMNAASAAVVNEVVGSESS